MEIPFGLWAGIGPKNHVLDGGPDPPWEGAIFGARGPIVKGHSAVTCAKTAEPIEMPFGLWAWSGSGNHELDGGPDPPTRRGNFGKKVTHCKV